MYLINIVLPTSWNSSLRIFGFSSLLFTHVYIIDSPTYLCATTATITILPRLPRRIKFRRTDRSFKTWFLTFFTKSLSFQCGFIPPKPSLNIINFTNRIWLSLLYYYAINTTNKYVDICYTWPIWPRRDKDWLNSLEICLVRWGLRWTESSSSTFSLKTFWFCKEKNMNWVIYATKKTIKYNKILQPK